MNYTIEQDEDAGNPRTEYDNAATMVCWHRRYTLGDKHDFRSPADFEAWWKENGKGGIRLPLYLYDHSGLTMNTTGFSCPWDSGQVGWIYVTRETIRKEWGRSRKKAEAYLRGEVETFDQYLRGDVWGFIVKDDQGKELDSCWGFYGREYCEEQAKAALEYCQEHALSEGNAI